MKLKYRSTTILAILMAGLLGQTAGKAQDAEPKAARSVHLWYPAPEGQVFYNEAEVAETTSATYFCAAGFNHGYFGIQQLGDDRPEGKRKLVIFSIWDPGDQDDPNAVKKEERVELLFRGDGVRAGRFGGEGTGGQSFFDYNWKTGQVCRFAVRAFVDGKKTAYAGFFYLEEEKRWKHLVTFRTRTGGDWLKGYYSFVEDFRRDGRSPQEPRRAFYGHGWVQGVDSHWTPLLEATFTGDRTPRTNIDAGTQSDRFFLATGGAITQSIPLKTKLHLQAPTSAPASTEPPAIVKEIPNPFAKEQKPNAP